MKLKSRYVFGAAMAATAFGSIDGIVKQADAAPITAAGFTFESLGTPGAVSSFSYAGESGGTLTMFKTATGGSISSVAGNGSPKSLTANNLYGGFVNVQFSIDNIDTIALSFDSTGSATGPRDFVLSYSTDGLSYATFATYFIQSTGASTSFSAGTFSPNVVRTFALPAGFSDSAPGVAGDFGYIQIAVLGTAPINGTATASSNTGGTSRLDNVFVTGSTVVPEPATASILTLAAAAMTFRRRR